MPGLRERNIFDVIFDKMDILQGELSSKEQNEDDMGRRLKITKISLKKNKEKVKKLKEETEVLYAQIQKMQPNGWIENDLWCLLACIDFLFLYFISEREVFQ